MSVALSEDGRSIHYPTEKDKFSFDKEVSSVFDDMALRSIPLYLETHKLHAKLAVDHIEHLVEEGAIRTGVARVLDVGCSTAKFLTCVYEEVEQRGLDIKIMSVGIEPSGYMLQEASKVESRPEYVLGKINKIVSAFPEFHIANQSYVLQFIPPSDRRGHMRTLRLLLARCGLLFMSGKYAAPEVMKEPLESAYYAMRRDNGYTQEEIDAKTAALANSMWVETEEEHAKLMHSVGYRDRVPTTRWGQFTSAVWSTKL